MDTENTNNSEVYTIDATGKRLGRVATEAASVLSGKTSPEYVRNRISGSRVRIENTSHLDISEAKRSEKLYERYSGHPGGLKKESLETVAERHGYGEVLRKAIYGMLPSNKLRAQIMKRLEITE